MRETLWTRLASGLLISFRRNSFYLIDRITLVLLVWKCMGLFLMKNYISRAWDCLFLLNWIGALTLSLLLKLSPRKVVSWALIRSMKFLYFEVLLHLYKSTIRPCMEYCYHVWTGAPICYLNKLDALKKQIYKIVGPGTYCFSWILDLSLKCSQLKSFP